jgi:S1/P1 nuclease
MRPLARVLVILLLAAPALGWGRKGHEIVNRLAVGAVPAELRPFYVRHQAAIVAAAMEADDAKRATGCEDVFHFVDLDQFGDPKDYPRSIDEGVRRHGLDAFTRSGLLPWRVKDVFEQLVAAWKAKDVPRIVKLSAWMGHYAGDAHVPLHATANYDGQLTGNDGVHRRYETDMVDAHDYDKLVAPLVKEGREIADPFEATFEVALDSLSHVAAVLKADAEATSKEPLLKPGPDGKLPKRAARPTTRK